MLIGRADGLDRARAAKKQARPVGVRVRVTTLMSVPGKEAGAPLVLPRGPWRLPHSPQRACEPPGRPCSRGWLPWRMRGTATAAQRMHAELLTVN